MKERSSREAVGLRFAFVRIAASSRSWFRAVFYRNRLECDMEAELQNHLESLTADLIRAGHSPAEAARRARIELGPGLVHKEEMRVSLGLRWWDMLVADLRYGWRMLRKSPGFTAVATISLALAIGANTAIFSVMKLVLLDRLEVPQAEQLKLLHWRGDQHTAVTNMWGMADNVPVGMGGTSFSYPAYEQLRHDNRVLEDLFAFKDVGRMNATIDSKAQSLQGELVSGNFFDQLRIRPQLGRPILSTDDRLGAPPVALMSDALWQRTFGNSPSVIGRMIKVNLVPVEIIGVTPRGFTGAKSVQSAPDLFFPMSDQPLVEPRGKAGSLIGEASPEMWWLNIMGRAKPGIPDLQAEAALNVSLASAVEATLRPDSDDTVPHLILSDGSRGLFVSKDTFGKPAAVLMAVVSLVLLLACANISSLLLARSNARQLEVGMRLALGAGRTRVLRQLLTESLLLSTIGGALGMAVAFLGCSALPKLVASPWESTQFTLPFDWSIFTFTAGLTLVTGLLFGIAPAWSATRTPVGSCLKETAQTATRRRKGLGGRAVVAFQITLSTLLVTGALLFLRTLINLSSIDPGFRTDHLLLFAIQQPESRYPPPQDLELHRRIEERLRALPGVDAVTLSEVAYISEGMESANFLPEGEKLDPNKEQSAWNNAVGAGFFKTMGIPILAGRDFDIHDKANATRVGILSESLAHKAFPGVNPVGRHFLAHWHPREGKPGDWIEVVGVCADTRYWTLKQNPVGMFYEPYLQTENLDFGVTYEVRTRLDPESLAPAFRDAVQSIDPDLPLQDLRTQREQIDATMQQERIFASLTAAFGVLALALACVGVYGVVAYSVAQRTNEIGIRLALGALPRQVLAMVLREASWLSLAGVAVGIAAALVSARLVKSLLYGLQPTDPVVLAGAAILLLGVGLASSWIPARRAARLQPIEALRHE
jgi:predicted permease